MSRTESIFAASVPMTEPAFWVAPVMALSLVLVGLRAFAGA
jgi:hypothetical protein